MAADFGWSGLGVVLILCRILSILSEIKFGNFVPLSRVFRDLKRQILATCPFVPHLVGVTELSDDATVFDRSSEILANFAKINQATKL